MKVDLTRSEIKILINVIKPLWQESIENPELADALEKFQSVDKQCDIINEKMDICGCESYFNADMDSSMKNAVRIFHMIHNNHF